MLGVSVRRASQRLALALSLRFVLWSALAAGVFLLHSGEILLVLLVPYVLTLVYRTGHPGSTLMLWQKLTGGTVSRQWMDLAAMSPALLPEAT